MSWTIGEKRFGFARLGGSFADRDGGYIGHSVKSKSLSTNWPQRWKRMLTITSVNC